MAVEAGRCEAFKPDDNEVKAMNYAAQTANWRSPLTAWIASMRKTPGEQEAHLRAHLEVAHNEQHFVQLYESNRQYEPPVRTSVARLHAVRHERDPTRGDNHRALFEYSR